MNNTEQPQQDMLIVKATKYGVKVSFQEHASIAIAGDAETQARKAEKLHLGGDDAVEKETVEGAKANASNARIASCDHAKRSLRTITSQRPQTKAEWAAYNSALARILRTRKV